MEEQSFSKSSGEEDDPRITVNPALKTALLLTHSLGVALFASFFLGMFFGPITAGIFAFVLSGGTPWAGIFPFIGFLVIWVIAYFWKKKTLENTQYKFYSDKVEYFEGFLVRNRKTVSYRKVTNVGQKEGIFERIFGLGSVYLDTAGSSKKGHEVGMHYLEDPNKVYDAVTELVRESEGK